MKNDNFATRFKQAVKLAGVPDTNKSLGKLLRVSASMVGSYRNDEKLPRMQKAIYIANQLNVRVEWLLQGTGPRQRSPRMKEDTVIYTPKKSSQAIMEFIEELSEAEHKKILEVLRVTFD